MISNPILSKVDFSRLMPLLAASATRVTQNIIDQLDEKLATARLVEPEAMRADVVTMNSKVILSSPNWDAPREFRLVYPGERSGETGALSVLSALGTELLGARVGTRLAVDSGPSSRVVELSGLTYQPEAAGDWHL